MPPLAIGIVATVPSTPAAVFVTMPALLSPLKVMVPELVTAVAFWIALPELMTVVPPTWTLPLTRFRLSPVARSRRLAAPRYRSTSAPKRSG